MSDVTDDPTARVRRGVVVDVAHPDATLLDYLRETNRHCSDHTATHD